MEDTEAVSITPIPLWNNEEWKCRYVFGYSLDDSDNLSFWYGRENRKQWPLSSSQHPEPGSGALLCSLWPWLFSESPTSSARALGISENNISEDSSVSIELANSLQPLQHGIPCETYSEESKNYSAEEVQPVAEEMEESSPNGSDSEASSSSQSTSTVAF